MFKIEKKPLLWSFLTVFGLELSKLVIKENYFEYFKNSTVEFILFLILELIIFISLAYAYKHIKIKQKSKSY